MVVEVSRNGVDYTEDGRSVLYHKRATLKRLRPSTGPEDGGAVVTVVGEGMSNGDGHGYCSFGGRLQPRIDLLSSSMVLCSTPRRTGAGNVTVDLVSGYGVEAGPRGLRYEYVGAGRTTSITPSSGPVEGGTVVTVLGRWEEAGSLFLCSFDGSKASATMLSSSVIKCASPASGTNPHPPRPWRTPFRRVRRSAPGLDRSCPSARAGLRVTRW